MAELRVTVLKCHCGAIFRSSDWTAAQTAFRIHVEARLSRDEHWHYLDDDSTYGETRDMPTRERYGDLTEYLAAMVGWMAQVTHEAYHDSQMSVQACEQTLCREAKVALGEIGEGDGYGDGGT